MLEDAWMNQRCLSIEKVKVNPDRFSKIGETYLEFGIADPPPNWFRKLNTPKAIKKLRDDHT